jgi:hypothetical protein
LSNPDAITLAKDAITAIALNDALVKGDDIANSSTSMVTSYGDGRCGTDTKPASRSASFGFDLGRIFHVHMPPRHSRAAAVSPRQAALEPTKAKKHGC